MLTTHLSLLIPYFSCLIQGSIRDRIIFMGEGKIEISKLFFGEWNMCNGSFSWSSWVGGMLLGLHLTKHFPSYSFVSNHSIWEQIVFQREGNDENMKIRIPFKFNEIRFTSFHILIMVDGAIGLKNNWRSDPVSWLFLVIVYLIELPTMLVIN